MIDARQLARAGFTYLGRLYSEMDCQAFVERCLRDCGCSLDLPGSNAWFRKMTWTGTPEECSRKYGHIPVGAFLFILNNDGKEPEKYKSDGIGNASHIGIYTGTGKGAIHSSYSKGCVVESSFRGHTIHGGWNRVGLWEMVRYDVDIKGVESMDTYEAVVIGGKLNLRATTSATSERLASIPKGSRVTVSKEDGAWSFVAWNGLSGWVMSEFLQKDAADDGSEAKVNVPKADLEKMYDQIGDWLGRRG